MSAEQAARQSALEACAAYVEQCYQGEMNGEALFRAMVALSKDAHAQQKLRVLEQLERETKEFVRPVVERTGRSVREDPKQIAAGEKFGTTLASMPWAELMKVFEDSLVRFVAQFEQSEKLATPGNEPVLAHYTAHERALLEFTRREIRGDADSLAPVVAMLRTNP